MNHIYDTMETTFKVNIGLGRMLKHVESGKVRFFPSLDSLNLLDGLYKETERRDVKTKKRKVKSRVDRNPLGRRGPYPISTRANINSFMNILNSFGAKLVHKITSQREIN